MKAVSMASSDELPDAARTIIEAIQAGELDGQMEATAKRGLEYLGQKASIKTMKKGSGRR